MFYEAPQNPSYIVQPANQAAFTAIPVYTPSKSSPRYVTQNNNNEHRVIQTSSLVRTPINNINNHVPQYYAPSNSNSSLIITPSDRSNQQQPILVINPRQSYVTNNKSEVEKKTIELEKVRVIGNNEREFFKDGTSVYRSYKYCTCCRARFVKACPTWNYMVWFYSFPCWVWFLITLLFLALLGTLIFLITQMPSKILKNNFILECLRGRMNF